MRQRERAEKNDEGDVKERRKPCEAARKKVSRAPQRAS
jgi:hypothetical protein